MGFNVIVFVIVMGMPGENHIPAIADDYYEAVFSLKKRIDSLDIPDVIGCFFTPATYLIGDTGPEDGGIKTVQTLGQKPAILVLSIFKQTQLFP
jgi:hypothetical protein